MYSSMRPNDCCVTKVQLKQVEGHFHGNESSVSRKQETVHWKQSHTHSLYVR